MPIARRWSPALVLSGLAFGFTDVVFRIRIRPWRARAFQLFRASVATGCARGTGVKRVCLCGARVERRGQQLVK